MVRIFSSGSGLLPFDFAHIIQGWLLKNKHKITKSPFPGAFRLGRNMKSERRLYGLRVQWP